MPQCHAVSSAVNEALNITLAFVPDWLLNCFHWNFSESHNSILDHRKTILSLWCTTMTNFGSKLFRVPIWCWGVIVGDSHADRGGSPIVATKKIQTQIQIQIQIQRFWWQACWHQNHTIAQFGVTVWAQIKGNGSGKYVDKIYIVKL